MNDNYLLQQLLYDFLSAPKTFSYNITELKNYYYFLYNYDPFLINFY